MGDVGKKREKKAGSAYAGPAFASYYLLPRSGAVCLVVAAEVAFAFVAFRRSARAVISFLAIAALSRWRGRRVTRGSPGDFGRVERMPLVDRHRSFD